MKKTISLMLCLLLIFSSVNFAFAVDWSTTDQNNLQSIKNALNSGGGIYNLVNSIHGRLVYNNTTIPQFLNSIDDDLFTLFQIDDADVGRRSITWWLREAVKDLDIIAGTGSGTLSFNVLEILNQLSYFSSGGARQSWLQKIELDLLNNGIDINTIKTNAQTISSDVATIKSVNTANIPGIYAYSANIASDTSTYLPALDDLKLSLTNTRVAQSGFDISYWRKYLHQQLITDNSTGTYALRYVTGAGGEGSSTVYSGLGSPLGNIALILSRLNNSVADSFYYRWHADLDGFNNQQSATNWLTLNNSNFTPVSAFDGLYKWLSNIQTPIARLAYVHASDEEIAAREKAEANQTAVVNNFIDSSGSGAAPASNFSDIASMSSGYTSNMDTDASASGIWNIFNSNNFGWFSQETVNQLDTTISTRKGYSDFETPLLDQQISEIYRELGVNVND